MGEQLTCHGCVYAHWDPGLWLRSLGSGFPARPVCGNQPDSPGRMKECPCGGVCRNYRAKPPVPTGENVKQIPLTKGFYAYVDAEDYEWLSQWRWRVYGGGYAVRWEKRKLIFMHRQIMQPPKGKVVDHVNGNGFDNTRANMRNITPQQNSCNRSKQVGTISMYKGVDYDKRSDQWYARIRVHGKLLHLGYFDTEVEAARAYDRGAVELFGEFAGLNFPEEWPPERRAQVYAERQKDRRKTRGKKKVRSREDRKVAARKKPRTGGQLRRILPKGQGFAQKGRLTMDAALQLKHDCGSEFHQEHLCYIVSQGFNLTDERGYRDLVEEPAFRCDHCGRTAKSGANLCVPVKLQ